MNSIFAHFISRGDAEETRKRLAYTSWFTDVVPISEFESDERLFWLYLEYSSELSIPINYKYFQIWLNTELREILHKTNIHVIGCEALSFDDPVSFETAVRTTIDVLSDNFKVLETIESPLDEFKIAMAQFFKEKKESRLTSVLAETFEILNKTSSSESAGDYILDAVTVINDIYSMDNLEELEGGDVSIDKTLQEKVSDCGLPAIDNDSGGIYTTQLVGVEAQPGTGKTRFTLGTYVYRALTKFSKNVLFLALEQTEVEIRAMLIACHVFHMFNIQISDNMILRNRIPDEVKAQVEAAKIDLFESGKYGKFKAIECDLYAETFINKIRTWDKLHGPFDLIAIDYMGLIESQPAQYKKELTEYEIIKTSFKQFKRYLRRNHKAGIAVSQFNRDGIQAGKADKEITTEMAQGGLAVYRNTDYNIAMSMTDTMRLQQKRRFSQPKVRSTAGFPSFIVDVRLGFCYFRQVVQKEV